MSIKDIFLALLVVAIWGGNFIAAKIGMHYFPPLFLTGLRLLAVALVLVPFVGATKLPLKQLYMIGFSHGIAYHGLIFTAIFKGLSVSATAITMQLNVPMTLILSAVFLKEKISFRKIIGMLIALSGVIIIFGSPHIAGHLKEFFYALGSALFFAAFNIQVKQNGKFDILPFFAYSSLIAAPQLFLLSYFFEPKILANFTSLKLIFSILYMVVSTIVGFGLWFYLLQKYEANIVAPFTLLIPAFSIINAVFWLNEKLYFHTILGCFITIIGVSFIQLNLKKLKKINYFDEDNK